MSEPALRALATSLGLRLEHEAWTGVARVIRDSTELALDGPAGAMLFQGTLERCGDYLRGWAAALEVRPT